MSKRLFIAVDLTADIRNRLEHHMQQLQAYGVQGRFVPANNLHITIAFLGCQSIEHMHQIETIFSSIPLPYMSLRIEGLDFFGNLLFAAIKPDKALDTYAQTVRAAMAKAGITQGDQPFHPHITLARKVKDPRRVDRTLAPMEFDVERTVLYQSLPVKDGVKYVELMDVPLSASEN